MIRIYHYFCIKAKNMFENFASIMNKASVQNEKSNILNGLKLPIIAVFLLGVVLISFALITTNTIVSSQKKIFLSFIKTPHIAFHYLGIGIL